MASRKQTEIPPSFTDKSINRASAGCQRPSRTRPGYLKIMLEMISVANPRRINWKSNAINKLPSTKKKAMGYKDELAAYYGEMP